MNFTITAHAAIPTQDRPCGGYAAIVELPTPNNGRDPLQNDHYTAEGRIPSSTREQVRQQLATHTLRSLAHFTRTDEDPKGTIHTSDQLTAAAFLEEISRRNIPYIQVVSEETNTQRTEQCRRIAHWHAERAYRRGTPTSSYAIVHNHREGMLPSAA